jgi:hypothetical protein
MKRTLGVLVTLCLFVAVPSFAQNARSFVATTGNDANNCTRGNECRTITRAIAVTNAGGEIVAIDSGGFSPFTLGKSMTISGAPGVVAAVNGTVNINTGSSDRVILRNLTVNNQFPSAASIQALTSFADFYVENCTLVGSLTVAGPGNAVTVSDTTVISTGSSAANFNFIGIAAKLIRCRAEGGSAGQYGVYVLNATATLIDVVVANSSQVGYNFQSTTADTNVTMEHCSSTHDGVGLLAAGYASGAFHVNVRLNNCNFNESQQYGIAQLQDSTIYSMGNNMISVAAGAFGDVSGTITPATHY